MTDWRERLRASRQPAVTPPRLGRVDRDALKRAIGDARAQDPGRDKQISSMLATRPWFEVARFAAYCCQDRALRLRPWQSPPCWMGDDKPAVDNDDTHGDLRAWQLRRRLIEAGLSPYEPDPIAALEAATKPAA
jgi:hypothetical protein